jgi:hypothetical protein
MKRLKAKHRLQLSPRLRRILIISACSVAGVFILANVLLWFIYNGRTYPGTKLMGANIGNTSYGELSAKVDKLGLLPETMTLTHEDKKAEASLRDLGLRKDVTVTTASAREQKSWLPVYNLFSPPELEVPVKTDTKQLQKHAETLKQTFVKAPVNARLNIDGAKVAVVPGVNGYDLDTSKLQAVLLKAIAGNKKQASVAVKQTQPAVKPADLNEDKLSLEAQINTAITFRYNDKTKAVTPDDVAKWFTLSGDTYGLSKENVRAYLTQLGSSFGIRISMPVMVDAAVNAVNNRKSGFLDISVQTAEKTFTYCTAARGVATSNLSALRSKLAGTYSDSRGWSLGGRVEFKESSSGCDFTVWLAEASQMPTFGAICDSMWSCRVGSNVVINYDRWTGASPAWNANGGTLDGYRDMVINHETGHWLGFGHDHCPGAGQSAPVMQQQSIDLQGCTFSPWPSASEQSVLRKRLGLN